jgi:hypothetical protein
VVSLQELELASVVVGNGQSWRHLKLSGKPSGRLKLRSAQRTANDSRIGKGKPPQDGGLTFNLPTTGVQPEPTRYNTKKISGKPSIQLNYLASGVPLAQAARFDSIGTANNPDVRLAPERLFASGGATSLDGMDIAHVVFFGVEVHYGGAQAILRDVIFVNCTFVFDNSKRTRALADEILASRNISFPPEG